MQEVRIRTYGRTELAQMYSPEVGPQAAWLRLREWMAFNKELAKRLREVGYDGHHRTFTPKQVGLIFEYLGEP